MNTASELTTNATKVKITRRSQVGWAWAVWTPDEPEPPAKPKYVGTPRQVMAEIDADRDLKFIISGNTFYTAQWFVKINGHWTPVSLADDMYDLFIVDPSVKSYFCDSIDAVVKQ